LREQFLSKEQTCISGKTRDGIPSRIDATSDGARPGLAQPGETETGQGKVGRITARQALRLLEQDGIVLAGHGRGRLPCLRSS
jgi:DNA-binding FadR family transcriptional regulator